MKTYSLNEVTLNVGGVPLDEQIGEISLEANNERFTFVVGVDGEVTMCENKDDSHVVLITCMASSDVNTKLSGIYRLARNSPAGNLGIVPINVSDRQGTSTFIAAECVITGWPKRVYAPKVGDVQWKLFVANPERFDGGN
jgi:hypothetical protein